MSAPATLPRRLVVAFLTAAGGLVLPATAAEAASDAPSSYRSVATTSSQDSWLPGVLSSTRDVDTYRFATSRNGYVRILLGDLAADYRLRLLDASGRSVATSDRPGRVNEEIYWNLRAGTHYVSVDAPHGRVSSAPYAVRFTSLREGLHVLSSAIMGKGPDRCLVFEVLNNTARTISGVGWSVAPPSCSGWCPPYEIYTDQAIAPRDRTTFDAHDLPRTGEVLRVVAGAPVTFTTKLTVTLTSAARGAFWTDYAGRLTNAGAHTACGGAAVRNAYDDRGGLVERMELQAVRRLKSGASSTWRLTMLDPVRSAVRVVWDIHEAGPSAPYAC
jgi:hypothetical protein